MDRRPMRRGAFSWLLVCALHGVASSLLWWAREPLLDQLIWHSDGASGRPWTVWTSAWVHLNTPQLITNQVVLGLLTFAAWWLRPPLPATLAWLLSWPLLQLTLPLWPHVGYSTGLSGPLHAGFAVLAVALLLGQIDAPKARRWGALLLLFLAGKLLLEQAWAYPVVWDTAHNRSVVRAAYLCGALWGVASALLMAAVWPKLRRLTLRGGAR